MKLSTLLFMMAVLVLCSCKRESFLTQRYTHLGHAKKSHDPSVVFTQASTTPKEKSATVLAVPAAEASATPSGETRSMASQQEYTSLTVSEPASLETQSAVRTTSSKTMEASTLLKEPAKQVVKAFQKQKDANAHRGLIFGVINLVLFIVIVAVVVALIIILVTAII